MVWRGETFRLRVSLGRSDIRGGLEATALGVEGEIAQVQVSEV
jgi:hypothetical protein